MKRPARAYASPPSRMYWRAGPLLLVSFLLASDASAVFVWGDLTTRRIITMQVGSSLFDTINTVTFDVTGNNVRPNPLPVTGVPDNPPSTAPVTPSNGVKVSVNAQIPLVSANSYTRVTLTVDSSTGLTCTSGCGSTIIPFSTISWTSYNKDTTYPGLDIQDGVFTGSASQTLAAFQITGGSITMTNVLVFQYANATLYPAGQYSGRVTYTASMP